MGTWFWQTVLAGAVLVPVGFVLIVYTGGAYDGFLSLIGYVVAPAIASFLLISAVSILGLPLRLIQPWRVWWRAHRWLSPGLAALGLLAIVVSRLSATAETWMYEGGEYVSYYPEPVLFTAGAFLLPFGLMHTWFTREPAAPER